MTLDPKGIEAALQEMIDKGDFYYAPDASDVENAILAYLKATDTVLVPREATEETIKAIKDWPHSYVHGPRSFYRAMIQAAEGK
jgi:hypothetical protein